MKFKVGDVVKVLYAPLRCVTNWPSMVGHIGFIEEMHLNGTRALVRTITINGAMHRLAFMDVWALELVDDPAWAAAVEKYHQTGGAGMSEQSDKPINPFEAAIHRSRGDVVASIGIHNVQGFQKDWTRQRAEMFLRKHADVIAHAMLAAGAAAIAKLAEQTDAN